MVIIVFLAFLPALKNDFVNWDDDKYITDNYTIKSISSQNIKNAFTKIYVGNWQPLTMLVYMLEYYFFKLNPSGYHAVNLALHIANTLLVFWMIFLLAEGSIFISLLCGLLFGIHPMHVESVVWAAELKDVLSAFFFFISIIAYLYFCKNSKRYLYFLSLAAFIMSLLAKPMAVSLPFVLLLADYLKWKRFDKKFVINKIPFLLITLIFCVVTILAQKEQGAIRRGLGYPVIYNVFVACYGILFYIVKLIIPINLSAFYPFPTRMTPLPPLDITLAPVVFCIIGAIIFYKARRNKPIVFGLLVYLVTVFPVSQIIPIGSALTADRYTYIPSIGVFYIIGYLLSDFILNKVKERQFERNLLYCIIGGIIIVFSLMTFERTKIWNNDYALWRDVLSKYPKSDIAMKNLGDALISKKDYEESLKYYLQSLDLNPYNSQTYNNVGNIYFQKKEYIKSADAYKKAIEIAPDYQDAILNLATVYKTMGDKNNALEEINILLEKNPENLKALFFRGDLFESINDVKNAIKDYSAVIALDPGNTDSLICRALLYRQEGMLTEALSDLRNALEAKPDSFEALNTRGLIYLDEKKYDEAISDFSKAILLKPNEASLYNNRGSAFVKQEKYENAVSDFDKAIALDDKLIVALQNRAFAFLKLGRNEDALKDINRIRSTGEKLHVEIIEEIKKIQAASLNK